MFEHRGNQTIVLLIFLDLGLLGNLDGALLISLDLRPHCHLEWFSLTCLLVKIENVN